MEQNRQCVFVVDTSREPSKVMTHDVRSLAELLRTYGGNFYDLMIFNDYQEAVEFNGNRCALKGIGEKAVSLRVDVEAYQSVIESQREIEDVQNIVSEVQEIARLLYPCVEDKDEGPESAYRCAFDLVLITHRSDLSDDDKLRLYEIARLISKPGHESALDMINIMADKA